MKYNFDGRFSRVLSEDKARGEIKKVFFFLFRVIFLIRSIFVLVEFHFIFDDVAVYKTRSRPRDTERRHGDDGPPTTAETLMSVALIIITAALISRVPFLVLQIIILISFLRPVV